MSKIPLSTHHTLSPIIPILLNNSAVLSSATQRRIPLCAPALRFVSTLRCSKAITPPSPTLTILKIPIPILSLIPLPIYSITIPRHPRSRPTHPLRPSPPASLPVPITLHIPLLTLLILNIQILSQLRLRLTSSPTIPRRRRRFSNRNLPLRFRDSKLMEPTNLLLSRSPFIHPSISPRVTHLLQILARRLIVRILLSTRISTIN